MLKVVQLLQSPISLLQLLEDPMLLGGGPLGLGDVLSIPWSRGSYDRTGTLLTTKPLNLRHSSPWQFFTSRWHRLPTSFPSLTTRTTGRYQVDFFKSNSMPANEPFLCARFWKLPLVSRQPAGFQISALLTLKLHTAGSQILISKHTAFNIQHRRILNVFSLRKILAHPSNSLKQNTWLILPHNCF